MFRRSLTERVVCWALAWAIAGVVSADVPRDPTEPSRWVPAQVADDSESLTLPVLTSVLIGEDRKLVVIDGRVMREGDQLGAVKVWRIESDHAVVSIGGRSPLKLWLNKHDMNKEVQ